MDLKKEDLGGMSFEKFARINFLEACKNLKKFEDIGHRNIDYLISEQQDKIDKITKKIEGLVFFSPGE